MQSSSLGRHRDPAAKKEVKLKKLEESWSIRPCQGIPSYSTETDKYCPLGITRHFNETQKRKVKASKASPEDTAHWIKSNISNKFEEVPERFTLQTVQRAELPPNPSHIPDASILHKIIVRENLITEVKKLIQHQNDLEAARSEVSELVKAIRFESLDIVDDISEWKKTQGFSREFLYRGVNYLVKMYSDLDFLDDYDEFNFGFSVSGNPFIFPYNGGRQLPDHLRYSTTSVTGDSGFVSRKTHMEDEILVDGIEVSRLQLCDGIVRSEVESQQLKQKSSGKKSHPSYPQSHPGNHFSANSQCVLAVGENGMNDSYMSAAPTRTQFGGQSVSFQDHGGVMHDQSAVSFGGSQLPPIHQSYSDGMSPTPGPNTAETSFASFTDNPPPAPHSEDSMRQGYSVESNSRGGKPKKSKKSRSVSIDTKASPPKASKHSVPPPKWVAKTSQIRQMKDRISVLTEEIGVIKAMHAHVSDQVDFKVAEHHKLTEIRDGLEKKRKQAIYQDRPQKAQDYAVKVNVADMELQQIHFAVKDLQRQRFFFEQEVKRKRQTVKRLQKDIEDVTRQTILQKKLEKRAKSEGLLAVLQSQNRGQSLDEANDGNVDFEMQGEGSELALSDDDSVLTEAAGEGGVNLNAAGTIAKGVDDSVEDVAEGTAAGVGPMDSTFSADIEPKGTTKGKFSEQEAITEEEPSPHHANITYLSDDKEEEMEVEDRGEVENTNPSEVAPAPTLSTDNIEGGSVDTDSGKPLPVAAGSGFTFAKQQSGTFKELLPPSQVSGALPAEQEPAAGESSSGGGHNEALAEKKLDNASKDELIIKEQTCVINNDVITVKVFSNEAIGTTTLRAYNDTGENTLTYQLIPALASQLKELSDEETNNFLTEMINSTVVVPSDSTNMGTEYATDATRKVDSSEDGPLVEDPAGQSSKSVVDEVYEVSVKDVTYSSRLEFKDDGLVEIHASNTNDGKTHIIPLLPVLAKQIVTLTYNQVAGVISDIIKTFTGP